MDRTETYIRMCEKAPREITKLDRLDKGEVGYCTYHKQFLKLDYTSCWECKGMDTAQWEILGVEQKSERSEAIKWGRLQKSDDWCEDKHWIRLPRQDRLQEMAECHSLFELTKLFESFCSLLPWGQSPHKSCGRFYGMPYDSMEQLWFAFVMKEKYGKIWDGGNWIEQK